MKNNIIWNNFDMLLTDHVDTRRQSEGCLTACGTESDDCSGSCEEKKNTCDSSCKEVESTCSWMCEQIAEEAEEDEDLGGVVGGDDDPAAVESSPIKKEIIWYIIIGILALLGVLCCCCIAYYLIRTPAKTANEGQSPAVEQVPMVPNARYAQQVGDQYMGQQYVYHGDYPAMPYYN